MLSTYSRDDFVKTSELQNSINVTEIEKLNDVSELSFSLPSIDNKNAFCTPFQLVRWDNGAYYRILDSVEEISSEGTNIMSYTAEHIIATLIDDVMFGTFQIDNLDTRQSIERLLEKQSRKNWILNECDFSRRFSYSWSNENLLTALFSIPKMFDQEYKWIFDTSTYPWRVSLKILSINSDPSYYVREGRNLISAEEEIKGRDICTRLYALGYGEGVNQLTFSSINNGKPYIDATQDKINKYGIISRIWEDLRFERADSLLARAKVLLDGYSTPYVSYTINTADIAKATGEEYDRAAAGKIVWYKGIKTYIIEVERHLQEEGNDNIIIANKPEDLATSISDLADRQRINSVYANGATNIYAQSFNDNADPIHPATIQFFIPSEARNINKVIVKWTLEPFRAFSIGAESTVNSIRTSSAGGRNTATSSYDPSAQRTSSTTTTRVQASTSTTTRNETSTSTSTRNETSTSTSRSTQTSTSTQTERNSTSSGGGTYLSVDSSPMQVSDFQTSTEQGHSHVYEMYPSAYVTVAIDLPNHNHTFVIPGHDHDISIPGHNHNVTIPGHNHAVTIPGHNHQVTIPGHSHTIDMPRHNHTVEIPDHTHTTEIPGHTHKTIYGIYEGPRANSISLSVDGRNVFVLQGQNEIDIASLLSTDTSGKIRRGAFHVLTITPNNLTRITATVSIQLFIQSEGGGLY